MTPEQLVTKVSRLAEKHGLSVAMSVSPAEDDKGEFFQKGGRGLLQGDAFKVALCVGNTLAGLIDSDTPEHAAMLVKVTAGYAPNGDAFAAHLLDLLQRDPASTDPTEPTPEDLAAVAESKWGKTP